MKKSYVAKTTINFVEHGFFVRSGDILIHDVANQNQMTIYRGGQIVKVIKQTSLGVLAMLKNRYIEETSTQTPPPPKEALKTKPEAKKPPSKPAPEPVKLPEAKVAPKVEIKEEFAEVTV